MIAAIDRLLEDAVRGGDPPAAAACAIHEGRVVHHGAHGASIDAIFDVASVTKIATTLSIATLIARGDLRLDDPAERYVPIASTTVRALLGHRSGLPAWHPFFVRAFEEVSGLAHANVDRDGWDRARSIVIGDAFATPIETPGKRVYSDLGFVALGEIVQKIAGESLDVFARREFFAKLGIDDVGFVDLREEERWISGRMVPPTGRTRPRDAAPGQSYEVARVERDHAGEVDDDNAFAMGGVAGHAGLFASARAIARLGWAIASEIDGDETLGLGSILRHFAAPDPADGPVRGLGFDMPAREGSSAGALLGQRGPKGAIGHLGFTGCSLWVDRDRKLAAALLTNRTLNGRDRVERIRALRPAFHDALCRALDAG